MANAKGNGQARDQRPAEQPKEPAPQVAPAADRRRKTDDEVEKEFRSYLTEKSDTISKFIRKESTLTALALVQAAGVAFRKEPDKLRDERAWRTVVTALVVAAQYDLEPVGREGWIVPREAKRWNPQTRRKESLGYHEWSFMPSFQGLVKQALMSGMVKSVRAHVVYEHDHCELQLGDSPGVDHRPTFGDRGAPIGVYAIARMTDGAIEIEPMSWSEVEKIRNAASEYSDAWKNWETEMARKSALKRLTKQLPAGRSFLALVQLDNALESGRDDDRQAAIEAALGDKIKLLPEAERSIVEGAFARASSGSKSAGEFAARLRKLAPDKLGGSEAAFAAAAVRNHEGATTTALTAEEAKNPPANVSCSECGQDVRVGGLDVQRWDVFDDKVVCGPCEDKGPPADAEPDPGGWGLGAPDRQDDQ